MRGAGPDRYIEIRSSSEHPKAIFLREGTTSHSIGAPGQFLFNPYAEFAARGPVIHPGTAPNNWADRALQLVEAQVMDRLASTVVSYLEEAIAA